MTTPDEYNFVKDNVGLGEWNISWIGAYQDGRTTRLVNGEGSINYAGWTPSPWGDGQPVEGNYGVAITGAGYGGVFGAYPGDQTCGEYVVEYSAVPEPGTAGILLLAGGGMLAWRRARRQATKA